METQLVEGQTDNREVTLVIPATDGTGDVKGFLNSVREKLQARIVKMTGSARETVVTIELANIPFASDILDEITNMPEVHIAEEKKLKMPVNSQQGILVVLGANPN